MSGRYLISFCLLCCLMVLPVMSQEPVPTLVPPTPVPVTPTDSTAISLTESAVARIAREGRVRVGILFNEPPYGELRISGDVAGFDASLAREIAETWGVEVSFVQVTRLNAIEMLQRGQVDLLLAAMVHRRELDDRVQFSQTYRVSQQAMMVRAETEIETLVELANQRIGYVFGTDTERAINEYMADGGVSFQFQPYATLDRAFVALFDGQINGLAGRQEHLLRVAAEHLDQIRLLDDPIQPESYAIAMHRQDNPLRKLVNRTLQYLYQEGILQALYEEYFPGDEIAGDALPLWQNAGDADALVPAQVNPRIPAPSQPVIQRMTESGVLRVAGLETLSETAREGEQRVATFNQQLVERMAARWGVRVEYVDGDPIARIESGQADVAVGLTPDWSLAERVDFSVPYLLRGDRLMTQERDNIEGLADRDLLGGWVGIMDTDTGARDRLDEWIDSLGVTLNVYTTFEQDAARAMLVDNNVDVIFGDSLKLIPHLEANPELSLTDRWYNRRYMVMAVPRGDVDFRLLVDYTLQDFIQNGDLLVLLRPVIPPGSEPPAFEVWSGTYPEPLPGL